MKMESPKLPKEHFIRSGYFKGWLAFDPKWTKKELELELVRAYLSFKEEKSN